MLAGQVTICKDPEGSWLPGGHRALGPSVDEPSPQRACAKAAQGKKRIGRKFTIVQAMGTYVSNIFPAIVKDLAVLLPQAGPCIKLVAVAAAGPACRRPRDPMCGCSEGAAWQCQGSVPFTGSAPSKGLNGKTCGWEANGTHDLIGIGALVSKYLGTMGKEAFLNGNAVSFF